VQLKWALRGGEPWTKSPYNDTQIKDTWRSYLLVNRDSAQYAFTTGGPFGAVGSITKEAWSSLAVDACMVSLSKAVAGEKTARQALNELAQDLTDLVEQYH
jgi:hypothetical protein